MRQGPSKSEVKLNADIANQSGGGQWSPGLMLQRKCACGNHAMSGACDNCAKKESLLQRMAAHGVESSEAPSIVHEVLHSTGQPLDASTRAFMEPRFGHDFSRVRLHTDAPAAESARRVNALAYTVGRDIVFGAQQPALNSSAGRELLAHELAHVVQQQHVAAGTLPTFISQPSDAGEVNAEQLSRAVLAGERHVPAATESSSPLLARQIIPQQVHCTAGNDGAPADPVGGLNDIVFVAQQMTAQAAILLRLNAELTKQGNQQVVGNTVDQAFNDRFGEPPEVAGGFMNRITGAVRPSLRVALSEEMFLMAKRFEMIADQLESGHVHYICLSTTRTFAGRTADCAFDATSFPNFNGIFICPGFWAGNLNSATLLIHEVSHMIWERVFHGAVGSGGNFRHAECYASFVGDIFNQLHGAPPCPPT